MADSIPELTARSTAKKIRALGRRVLELRDSKERLLWASGWDCSSDYPDCSWRWSKTFAGKVITGNTDQAFALELHLAERW